ncbi:MAG: glycosyltransferase family 4 protein [Bacteroidetes bacterium]|nr:glycosyltransferase family 4 protein [Bacteroidota bacterium]
MDKLSTKIITNSKYTASLAKQYFPNDKMEVIYNSLSDEWFTKKADKPTKREIVVGTVANVTANLKNHSLVIEVANVIRNNYSDLNVLFHIYGNLPADDSQYFSELKKRIKTLQLTDNVIFMGRKEAKEIYNIIDVLFHPFGNEGFGRIFIEAMGSGVPVVAVKGGGADELIENGRTGYKVDPDNPEQAANIIVEIIRNTTIYSNISLNGFKYASSQFKNSVMWDKIESCYNSVVR